MRNIIACFLLTMTSIVTAGELQPGQVWSYKTRHGEEASTITVLKVENYTDIGQVVHIRVNGIRMKNPLKGNIVTDIPHLPFGEMAVQKSITKLIRSSNAIPEFQVGYDTWKKAYLSGHAGAFDSSVGATLDAMLGAQWEEK